MSRLTDADAAAAIAAHHVELSTGIRDRVDALVDAVRAGLPWRERCETVLDYLDGELLPHARAEEQALYPAGQRGETTVLVRAMLDEHVRIVAAVDRLRVAETPLSAAIEASVVLALFESHLAKENDQLIPSLVADPGIAVGALLEGMHELVG